TYLSRPADAAVPPYEDVMFMNQRQFLNQFQRNQQGRSSSSGQPPIYPPAQTQEHTGVPVFAMDSFPEQPMAPEQVDQVQRDIFGEDFSGINRFAERDPFPTRRSFPTYHYICTR
ncbi:MAG: hypothetical protein ACKPKO_53270, partial [Candidatus Fonsibacter sp.]